MKYFFCDFCRHRSKTWATGQPDDMKQPVQRALNICLNSSLLVSITRHFLNFTVFLWVHGNLLLGESNNSRF